MFEKYCNITHKRNKKWLLSTLIWRGSGMFLCYDVIDYINVMTSGLLSDFRESIGVYLLIVL